MLRKPAPIPRKGSFCSAKAMIIYMKTVGIFIIFSICAFGGLFFSGIYRKRAEQLEAFRALIVFVGVQIESYRTPLDRIFTLYKNEVLDKCGFMGALCELGFERALEECSSRLFLTEAEISELRDFFINLGSYDGDNAVKHCAYYEKIFGSMSEKARTEVTPKSRICRALGFLTGIMLAVLFI